MRGTRSLPILFLICLTSVCVGQLPNGDFETWTVGSGYEKPAWWVTTNSLANYYGTAPTCEKGTPGSSGSFYAKVTSRSSATGVFILGTIATGDTAGIARGVPFSDRPAVLGGRWMYSIKPYDMGEVTVALNRWNFATGTRNQVAYGTIWMIDSIDTWQSFQVPLNYALPDAPDTVIITITASAGPVLVAPGSTISVDELAFSGTDGVEEADTGQGLQVFPMPARNSVEVVAKSPLQQVVVKDMSGRTVLVRSPRGTSARLDISGLAVGRYALEVSLYNGTRVVRPLVKD